MKQWFVALGASLKRALSYMVVSIVLVLALSIQAEEWRPEERFLNAIRFVESSNGRFLIGDGGRSLGDFQMSEAAWKDVTGWRTNRGLRTYDYRAHALNPKINRIYAADYLTILRGQLKKKLKRSPTPGEIYAAYNLGLAGFAQSSYKLSRVNSMTAKKCALISRMLQEDWAALKPARIDG
jgi:hypothetical protein